MQVQLQRTIETEQGMHTHAGLQCVFIGICSIPSTPLCCNAEIPIC